MLNQDRKDKKRFGNIMKRKNGLGINNIVVNKAEKCFDEVEEKYEEMKKQLKEMKKELKNKHHN